MSNRWTAAQVVPSLIADARGWRDKAWVFLYFVARQQILGRRLLLMGRAVAQKHSLAIGSNSPGRLGRIRWLERVV